MAVLESVMAVLLLVAAEAKEAAEAEERSDPARSLHMAKKSPAPGHTLKRYGSVLPGDKCEQSISAAAS